MPHFKPKARAPSWRASRLLHLAACTTVVFSSLVLYGVLQERIMTRPYFAIPTRRPLRHPILRRQPVPRPLSASNKAPHPSHPSHPSRLSHPSHPSHSLPARAAGPAAAPRPLPRPRGLRPLRFNAPRVRLAARRRGFGKGVASARGERRRGGAVFSSSLFLVLANRVVAVAVLLLGFLLRGREARADVWPRAPLWAYCVVSASNAVATSCQYEALKWLTFPTITVGKCAKMLPVMLILSWKDGKRYGKADLAVVLGVVGGAAAMVTGGNTAAVGGDGAVVVDDAYGYVLLAAYLVFDAITSTYQEHLFQRYNMTVYNQMLYINLSTGLICALVLTVTGALYESLAFLAAYPRAVPDVAALSLAAVAGQFAISHTISSFGALVYAAIMTARQLFSIIISNTLFDHQLTLTQWFGTALVFAALFARAAMKNSGQTQDKSQKGKAKGKGKIIGQSKRSGQDDKSDVGSDDFLVPVDTPQKRAVDSTAD